MNIPVPAHSRIDCYDYQQRAAEYLSRRLRALLWAPAGSGKTIMAALAIYMVWGRKVRGRKLRVAWLCATLEQCAQARAAFTRFPELLADTELLVFCAAGAPAAFNADLLVIDECHHVAAETWAAVARLHTGALWMMSATPFSGDLERDGFLRSLARENIYKVDRSVVSERLVPAAVHLLRDTDSNLQGRIDDEVVKRMRRQRAAGVPQAEAYKRIAAQVCVDIGITPNVARNAAIVRLARERGDDSTLILIGTIEHGEALQRLIEGSVLCFSRMGVKRRREAMEAFRARELRCMLATSLADEGLDLPVARRLILAGAGRSASRTEQRVGRVVRSYDGKESALVFDFEDLQHPLLARQSCARQQVYSRLGYRIVRADKSLELAA